MITNDAINLVPQFGERLSFRQLVNLPPEQRSAIRRISVIPPRLGRGGFGGVWVEYNTPVYRTMSLVPRRRSRNRRRR